MADFTENEFSDADENDDFSFLRLTKLTILFHSLETGEDSSELIDDIDAVIDGDAELTPELMNRITDFLDEGDEASENDDEEDSGSCFDYEQKPPVLTFNDHRVETAGHFTFEVPDNWIVKKDFDDFGTFRPILVAEKDFSDKEELGLTNHLVYFAPPVSADLSVTGLYELRWALNFAAVYSISLPICYCDWDTQVDAQNTRCFVHRKMGGFTSSVTYQINPYLSDSMDALEIIAFYDNDEDLQKIEEAVLHIASTIVVDNPPVDSLALMLERSKTDEIGFEEYTNELKKILMVYKGFTESVIENASHKYTNSHSEMDRDEYAVFIAKHMHEFYRGFAGYVNTLIDIRENQDKLGYGSHLNSLVAPLLSLAISKYPKPSLFGEEFSNAVENSDALDPDGEILALKYRLRSVFGDEVDRDIATELSGSDDSTVTLGSLGMDEDSAVNCSSSLNGYESWWQSISNSYVPDYFINPLGKPDLFALGWMFANGLAFNKKGDITWDGNHHAYSTIRLHLKDSQYFSSFADNRKEYTKKFLEALETLDADEGLRIPLRYIHPVTQLALPEGDLTGVSLFSLMQCNAAISITQDGPHSYMVYVDPRVATGIPDFHNLMGRMIWDMREIAGIEHSIDVDYANVRNFDANKYFGVNGFLDEHVEGVTSPYPRHFDSKPTVTVPDLEAIAAEKQRIQELTEIEDVCTNELFDRDSESFYLSMAYYALDFPIQVDVIELEEEQKIAERLSVGDKVILISDWKSVSKYDCPVKVYTTNREYIGRVKSDHSNVCYKALACLLPHASAAICEVIPKSQRRKNAKYSVLRLEINLDEGLATDNFFSTELDPTVKEEISTLIHQEPKDRARESKI